MAKAKMFYDKDGSLAPLKGKTVAVIGYGSQGHAHAQNLRDSGINVIVAELSGTHNFELAVKDGFKPISAAQAAGQGDLLIIVLPDEVQAIVYRKEIEPNLKPGKTLGFCHGFNIHFKQIVPPAGVDVVMIAPKGPGHTVRSCYQEGSGVPCLIAVEKDESGTAFQTALAWGIGLGGRQRPEAVPHRQFVVVRARQLGHDHLHPAVAEDERMGVPLAAVAEDGHGLALQCRQLGVLVVIHRHSSA